MQKHPAITLDRLRLALEYRLRPLHYRDRAPVTMEMHRVQGEPIPFAVAEKAAYEPYTIGTRFGQTWDTAWIRVRATIPASWAGKEVHARMSIQPHSWSEGFTVEGLFWRDGKPDRALNRFRPWLPLASRAKGGETIEFYVEVGCNAQNERKLFGVDLSGPPQCHVDVAELAVFDPEAFALSHDFFVLYDILKYRWDHKPGTADPLTEPLTARTGQILHGLNEAINAFHTAGPDGVKAAREVLKPLLAKQNGDTAHKLSAIGHAHIDTAWLWPLRETIRKCARTFSTQLRYMEAYPDYIFSCSQPAQYAWMKRHYPTIWEDIKKAVQRGQWNAIGSMWIEADCNLPNGESLARQHLHGKRFFMKEFGIETHDVWLPDVFGYSGNLPQIMRAAGVENFLTQKLSWNQFNRIPHHTFWWQGIDGSRVFTHFPPADTYVGGFTMWEIIRGVDRFKDHDRATHSVYPYGYGDGGGGPTVEMIEAARRTKDLEGVPMITMDTVESFFEKARAEATDLCTWVGELYFELHRATLTSQARNKRGNRLSEEGFRLVEMLDAAAWALGLEAPTTVRELPELAVYETPQHEDPTARSGRAGALERAWKLHLLNQFHDIIPGSSIFWVYLDSLRDYHLIQDLQDRVRDNALAACVPTIDTAGAAQPVLALNALGFPRAEVVNLSNGSAAWMEAPACGYAVNDLAGARGLPAGVAPVRVTDGAEVTIDNGLIRVRLDKGGCLTSVFDLQARREALAPGQKGNVFHLHTDLPNSWDAWDVDIHAWETRDEIATATSFTITKGSDPLEARVRFVRAFEGSSVDQEIIIRAGSRRIDFVTKVNWNTRKRFLKVAFPVDILSPHATYEIQYGHLQRPTHQNTSWDLARFEVAAQRWADLSETGYGVAVLNDSKYGYDILGNVIRLSLLRGSSHPDPEADLGSHQFTYSLFPHRGGPVEGGVVEEGARLNQPLHLRSLAPHRGGSQPARLSLVTVDRPGVSVEAIKVSEDGDALIVRLNETHGARGPCGVTVAGNFTKAARADLLERDQESLPLVGQRVEVSLSPFQIATLKFSR